MVMIDQPPARLALGFSLLIAAEAPDIGATTNWAHKRSKPIRQS
jgi:hypothetical protein